MERVETNILGLKGRYRKEEEEQRNYKLALECRHFRFLILSFSDSLTEQAATRNSIFQTMTRGLRGRERETKENVNVQTDRRDRPVNNHVPIQPRTGWSGFNGSTKTRKMKEKRTREKKCLEKNSARLTKAVGSSQSVCYYAPAMSRHIDFNCTKLRGWWKERKKKRDGTHARRAGRQLNRSEIIQE